ncbi:MAG: hypothetical protein JWN50_553 [Parcubacteria group bacterium]|nr:hypothetical protein [Parcubacteria group bacterium]
MFDIEAIKSSRPLLKFVWDEAYERWQAKVTVEGVRVVYVLDNSCNQPFTPEPGKKNYFECRVTRVLLARSRPSFYLVGVAILGLP